MAVFSGTLAMQVVIKRTGGLVWKNWPMNHTRRANAKKRHIQLAQVEAILRVCLEPPPPKQASSTDGLVEQSRQS